MAGAINWGGKATEAQYTGGFSAGPRPQPSRPTPARQSGSTQNLMRLQSTTPVSTASPATRRASTQPEDIYKVFPNDTGRNDVAFQDRFRTTPADALPGGGYLRTTQTSPAPEQSAPGGAPAPVGPVPTGAPTGPGGTGQQGVSPMEGGTPTQPEVQIPEKPSYLDAEPLPDYTEQFQQYEGITREVQPMETMQGQIHNIMEEGNPLMDMRRTQTDAAMAARGLYHSTSGVQAAEQAMLEAILPIASQDAATYANQANINQEFVQNASNMNADTFNREIAQVAQQGRDLQKMRFESDIRERLAAVDQRHAVQLETLKQEYGILSEQYAQAGTLYSDSLRSIASILGNNQLTPEQQAAGVESLVGQLEAGLQFMTGVSGGTVPAAGVAAGAPTGEAATGQVVSGAGAPVSGISNNATLGVYPGQEVNARNAQIGGLRTYDPLKGMVNAHAPDAQLVRTDQNSNLPSLIRTGNWYYRPEGWSEQSGIANAQLLQSADGTYYMKMTPLVGPEVQRLKERQAQYMRENPRHTGGSIQMGENTVATPPDLYLEVTL